jgi:hypothetical protein
MNTLTELIEDMIQQLPGITETALAGAVLGPACNLNQLEQACARLLKSGRIERRGEGTEKSPFAFYKGKANA